MWFAPDEDVVKASDAALAAMTTAGAIIVRILLAPRHYDYDYDYDNENDNNINDLCAGGQCQHRWCPQRIPRPIQCQHERLRCFME